MANRKAEGIELRLDFIEDIHNRFFEIKKYRQSCRIPVILTLRKKSQGGFYQGSESDRLSNLVKMAMLNPDFLDLEYDTPWDEIEKIRQVNPHVKLIASYHHFQETPQDLNAILKAMVLPIFHAYKIATMTQSVLDALRLFNFKKSQNKHTNLTVIGMGEGGQITRILSPVMGNFMHYASVEKTAATAKGQLSIDELQGIYRFSALDRMTRIYALLGDPVDSSVGHWFHNRAMRRLKENAVYVKMPVRTDELPALMALCRGLPFRGFSVTMPLKESMVSVLDNLDQEIYSMRAVNSVIKERQSFIGFNTDGLGGVGALCRHVTLKNKTVLILGAGGVARALVYELSKYPVTVLVMNRTLGKVEKLAQDFGCEVLTWGDFSDPKNKPIDICVNTLPDFVHRENLWLGEWLDQKVLHARLWVMDVVYRPRETLFLKRAFAVTSRIIWGDELYENQALLQLQRWFKSR